MVSCPARTNQARKSTGVEPSMIAPSCGRRAVLSQAGQTPRHWSGAAGSSRGRRATAPRSYTGPRYPGCAGCGVATVGMSLCGGGNSTEKSNPISAGLGSSKPRT